ncbi:Aste57867_19775 [Aphanomyces stellatus]|uniref:Aste57867_19775 protein n=1 Tax=Aphanomyces stellatus TaxID=120398 RepID=A0A485LDX4_9STRA|nr:hypothetical protein As57867_019710 [Aphanomyces stellatus]VFT96473.1 Aste57867_19775 [Aphanomyces stellatus]
MHAAFHTYTQAPGAPTIFVLMAMPSLVHLPVPPFTRWRQSRDMLSATILGAIESKERLQCVAPTAPVDIIDLMLPHTSRAQVVTDTLVFMVGYETIKSALGWVFLTLARDPAVAVRIRAEYTAAIDAHDGSLVNMDDVALPYTLAVVLESLRLNIPAFLIPRVALHDDYLPRADGTTTFLPKGTTVDLCTAAMHRSPLYWTNPSRFLPHTPRYHADRTLRHGKSHAFCYMPWSIGG